MIKSKVIFAVSFVALFACGVARADIASVQYVNDNQLTGGKNVTIGADGKINVPTLDESWYYYGSEGDESYKTKPVSGDAFMRALDLVLPSNYVNSDDWTFWDHSEMEPPWYNDGMSLSDIVKDLAYERVYPLTNQISSKQNKISTSYGTDCFEEEGEIICDSREEINNGLVSINWDGEVVGARLFDEDDGEFITDVTVEDDGTVTISRGDAPEEINDAGSVNTPVFTKDGKAQAVTSIKDSLLPIAVPESIAGGDGTSSASLGLVYVADNLDDYNIVQDDIGEGGKTDGSIVPTFGYVQDALGKKFELPDYVGLEDMGADQGDVLGFIVQDNGNAENEAVLAKIPYATKEDVANKVSQKPASYTTMDPSGKDSYDTQHYASLKYVDSKVDSTVSTIDISMAELNAKVGQNTANIGTLSKSLGDAEDAIDTKQDKLTAGAGIKIETNQTTKATTISAELGLIPAGTDKSQTATIWIE